MSDARALKKEGQLGPAIAKLNRALALQPDEPVLFRERAEVYVLSANFPAAINNFKRVIFLSKEEERGELTLTLGQVCYRYGMSLASESNNEDALEVFKEAELHDPANEKTQTRKYELRCWSE